MTPARVVEAVDVFEEGDSDLPAGRPVSAPNHFRLEGFEKPLNCGVVITVARYRSWVLSNHVFSGSRDSHENSIARLAETGIDPSVGRVCDSYGNAIAETIIGLFKTEVINFVGP